jgi:hypothetical protein
MHKRIGVIACTILILTVGGIKLWDYRRNLDSLPPWDWQSSQSLLTEPVSFCGPLLVAPGVLQQAELLAWRTATDSAHAIEIRDVLWWGQFETANRERRWVITTGRQRTDRTAWSHDYECDGNETRYRVFEQKPRSADLRTLTLLPFLSVDTTWANHLQIRRLIWRRLLQDSPALATSAFP